MRFKGYCGLVLLGVLGCVPQQKTEVDEGRLVQWVNPFVGTDGPGNTYPGATVPFGMVQLSPDIGISGWDRIAGYYYQDSIITGFSHTHLSGTGAGDLYDILVMPTNDGFSQRIPENNFKPFSHFSHNREGASPGYYWVDLLDYGIKAEMTATKRVGVHRYTFPKADSTQVHVDLGYALNWDKPTDTFLKVVNDSTIQGHRMSTGWARNQRLFFEMRFSKPFASHRFNGGQEEGVSSLGGSTNAKIVLEYAMENGEQLVLRTGLSSVSAEAAGKAIDTEAHTDFDAIRREAENHWEKELQKVRVITQDTVSKGIFYTMCYQSMLAPTLYSDSNGSYKTANDAEGKYLRGMDTVAKAIGFDRYDTFSLWDTFRAAHPLYTILHPERVPHMVKSLLAHYRETGLLPVWSMQGSETNMMIGYHAVPVIVDAHFKGFDFDRELAFEACRTSAMASGRQIDIYREKGFIPVDGHHENWSVSKTLEYAYDDWCIAMFAKDLGKMEDHDYFLARSKNWRNLYNEKNSWLQPKDGNGNFIYPFVPKAYTPYFCESNAWHYYWSVMQDIPGLIQKTGGLKRFEQKLDSMFTYAPSPEDKLPIFSTGMIGQYAHGNEPSHHVAYLYNYVQKPAKTRKLIQRIVREQYKNEPNGHCGNEDCGQMSSWLLFSAMGFYPVNPAQGVYDLGIPLFEELEIAMGEKKFIIRKEGHHTADNDVEAVFLNGEKLDRTYITHKEVITGGELVFKMTEPSSATVKSELKTPEVNKIY
ncbi:GH92 family glycosyl hydrolase [Muricauda sp. SCSIO 64092]|uniref:GH92 family glycosyl hydrolase n=1 Tax=Allomuricauda sp. SCSIO 64092 TaxID=2908842 RepID=UPI001FF5D92D|nr:GH92 family glycosyl hydrolase [Muricauda sp. SCSIO 64092]UOY05889.1 GH92 family glycosyl hydrolase [Muricauda sp. SCSIO 64092]